MEDVRHFILHCTYFQHDRDSMFNEICDIHESVRNAMHESRVDILYIVLGHPIENVDDVLMEKIHIVILSHVYQMYTKNSREKLGIG